MLVWIQSFIKWRIWHKQLLSGSWRKPDEGSRFQPVGCATAEWLFIYRTKLLEAMSVVSIRGCGRILCCAGPHNKCVVIDASLVPTQEEEELWKAPEPRIIFSCLIRDNPEPCDSRIETRLWQLKQCQSDDKSVCLFMLRLLLMSARTSL